MDMKNNLMQIRLEKNLSTNQLALLSGVSQSQITRIENNYISNVSLITAWRLAKALDVDIFDIFIME